MSYTVPPLPYDYDALEPYIDELTMQIHHDKHHQAYVDKANAALEGTEWADKPVEEVLEHLGSLPADKQGPVRNNAGGHYNHSLFWTSMAPGGGGEPDGALAAAIDAAFGSFADFQAKLKDAGVNRFGSGWAWLVHDELRPGGRLDRQPGQPDQRRARRRCSASTCGSTPTTSSTRTAAPTTSTRGGRRSTGARSPRATRRHPPDRTRHRLGPATDNSVVGPNATRKRDARAASGTAVTRLRRG